MQNITECLNFYIADIDQTALLSAEACQLLGLLTVNIVNSVDIPTKDSYEPLTRSQLLNDYKDVFEGLGSFSREYKIETDPSVKPVQHWEKFIKPWSKKYTQNWRALKREVWSIHNSNGLDNHHAECEETMNATHVHCPKRLE